MHGIDLDRPAVRPLKLWVLLSTFHQESQPVCLKAAHTHSHNTDAVRQKPRNARILPPPLFGYTKKGQNTAKTTDVYLLYPSQLACLSGLPGGGGGEE